MNNWYVYVHIRKDKNIPFYIGIGNKANHARAFEFKPDKRNVFWTRIFNKTEILVEILFDGLSNEEAAIKEIELIAKYGRRDIGTGILCNQTDGGDGTKRRLWTAEQREKQRQDKIGINNHRYGTKQSKEIIEKRTRGLIGKKHSEERKRKAYFSNSQKKTIDVFKYSTGEFVGRFNGITEACRVIGLGANRNPKAVSVAKGNRKHTGGFVFKYV